MLKYFRTKPQLLYLALLSFSTSFSSVFQLSNLSSIFKFLGASGSYLPLLWLAPPITGLLVQPIIGQISDDTITRWGKRKPYIICWGFLAAISFFLFPFANTLFLVLILTWIIDCAINGSTEGIRALTGDIIYREEERSRAFAMQAFFAGIGGAIGTALPYIIHQTYLLLNLRYAILPGTIPLNIKISFVFVGFILLAFMFLFMIKVKERPYGHNLLLQKKTKTTKNKQSNFKNIL